MRQSLLTVALFTLLLIAWFLRDLLMLVGFAALLAYALDPCVSWVERRRLGRRALPRGAAAGLVLLLLVLVAGVALARAVPRLFEQLVHFARDAPAVLAHLEQELGAFIEAHGWGSLAGAGAGAATKG